MRLPHEVLEQSPLVKRVSQKLGQALGAKKLSPSELAAKNKSNESTRNAIQYSLGIKNRPARKAQLAAKKLKKESKPTTVPSKPSINGARPMTLTTNGRANVTIPGKVNGKKYEDGSKDSSLRMPLKKK